MSEYQLENPPTDGISSIKLPSNSSKYVLASSWDRSVRLYDIESRQLLNSYNHDAPVLDCTFSDSVNRCFSGGLDCNLLMHDFETGRDTIVGQHSAAVRRVNYSSEFNLVITGSWDGQVKLWDPRSLKCIGSYDQPDKVNRFIQLNMKITIDYKSNLILCYCSRFMRWTTAAKNFWWRRKIAK
jgi:cell cycle arrest protein BUB3